jgi:outer membrane protein assembly factor BamE (lipoprotein component of BamABCDE complex)
MNRKVALVYLLVLCACQPIANSRGSPWLAEKIGDFVVGKTHESDVLKACGSPSFMVNAKSWIYLGYRSEDVAFRKIELKDRIVVRMTFDQNGVLKTIDRVNQDNTPVQSFDEEITGLIPSSRGRAK